MKRSATVASSLFLLLLAGTHPACGQADRASERTDGAAERTTPQPGNTPMRITIGTRTFAATLYDNATAAAFKALLPTTLEMTELNDNEKYARLSVDLPTDASNPGTIENGDLLLYGRNTVVLFYKTFPTSYSYTRIGRIEDPTGLASAVGSGSATVTFQLE